MTPIQRLTPYHPPSVIDAYTVELGRVEPTGPNTHKVPTTLGPLPRRLEVSGGNEYVARLCGPWSERLYERIGRSRKNRLGMDKERTAEHWLIKATPVLQRVTGAESRYSVSMRLSEVAMLAAADELEAATREATWWMAANACPDLELGGRVAEMLNTCTELALTTQRAIAGPYADLEAVIGRLWDLLAIIDFHTQALDAW